MQTVTLLKAEAVAAIAEAQAAILQAAVQQSATAAQQSATAAQQSATAAQQSAEYTASALANYTGSSTISTLGVITSGTWNATAIATDKGGLGADNSAANGVPLFAAGVVAITGTSGTGNFARVTSPTFVTPNLGTPTALVLTNATGLPNAGLLNSAITIAGTSTSLGGSITLDTIDGVSSGGLIAWTAANTRVARTITGTANQIAVSNGNGVNGNPTLTLPTLINVVGSNGSADMGITMQQTNGSYASKLVALNDLGYFGALICNGSAVAGSSFGINHANNVELRADVTSAFKIITASAAKQIIFGAASTEYGRFNTAGNFSVASSTASTSTTTGCATFAGGVGIAGSIFTGGGVSFNGSITGTTAAGTVAIYSIGNNTGVTEIKGLEGGGIRIYAANAAGGSILFQTIDGQVASFSQKGKVSWSPVSFSQSSWTTTGALSNHAGATVTDSSTATSGTATSAVFHSFAVPTLAATNSTVTTSDAANVYIAGAPTAGTNQTITRRWALWVASGLTRLGGGISIDDNNSAFISGGRYSAADPFFYISANLGGSNSTGLKFEVNNAGSIFTAMSVSGTGNFNIAATTVSTSTTTGCATFGGGVGIVGKLFVGNDFSAQQGAFTGSLYSLVGVSVYGGPGYGNSVGLSQSGTEGKLSAGATKLELWGNNTLGLSLTNTTVSTPLDLRVSGNLGVGNSVAASVAVGTLVKKVEIFDSSGSSLGYIPVYSSIT